MISQTFLEARQLGTRTSTATTNGDYTTVLNQPVVIEDGDELSLVNCFIDTVDITDNHIVVEEDFTAQIKYFMYADMGGWGVSDTPTDIENNYGPLQRSKFYSTDQSSPWASGQSKGVLSTFKTAASLSGVKVAQIIRIAPRCATIATYGGGTITLSYYGIDDIQYTVKLAIPKLSSSIYPTFILSLDFKGTNLGLPTFIFRTVDPQITVAAADSIEFNISFVDIEQSAAITENMLIPVLRTKDIKIKAGRYTPQGIVDTLNLATAALPNVQGFTPDLNISTYQNIFNKNSSEAVDELGPHFLSNTSYLKMGEEKVTADFTDRNFFVYDDGDFFQVYFYEHFNVTYDNEASFVGSSQGIQFEYDEGTTRINIIAMHSPLFVPTDVTDTGSELTLGINYQITSVWDNTNNNKTVIPFVNNQPDNLPYKYTYQTDMGGVVISDLEPRKFWEDLGFDIPSLTANPYYSNNETRTLSGVVGTNYTTTSFTATLPKFNIELGRNATGNFVDLAAVRPVTTMTTFLIPPLLIPGNAGFKTGLGVGITPFGSSITDTFKVESTKRVAGADLDSAYYLVEVDLHQNKMLNANGGEKRTIAGIINRYYSISSYTALEGGFTYIHRGEPMVINSLHIRILMPDGSQVQGLGTDNAVFLKLVSRIQTQINNIKKK